MLRKLLLALPLFTLLTGCEALLAGNMITSCLLRSEPELLPESLPDGRVGVAYAQSIRIINADTPAHGFYVSDATPLPEGLRMQHQDREAQGLIVGVPTQAGTYSIRITARTYGTQCTGQHAERRYSLHITE